MSNTARQYCFNMQFVRKNHNFALLRHSLPLGLNQFLKKYFLSCILHRFTKHLPDFCRTIQESTHLDTRVFDTSRCRLTNICFFLINLTFNKDNRFLLMLVWILRFKSDQLWKDQYHPIPRFFPLFNPLSTISYLKALSLSVFPNWLSLFKKSSNSFTAIFREKIVYNNA